MEETRLLEFGEYYVEHVTIMRNLDPVNESEPVGAVTESEHAVDPDDEERAFEPIAKPTGSRNISYDTVSP